MLTTDLFYSFVLAGGAVLDGGAVLAGGAGAVVTLERCKVELRDDLDCGRIVDLDWFRSLAESLLGASKESIML